MFLHELEYLFAVWSDDQPLFADRAFDDRTFDLNRFSANKFKTLSIGRLDVVLYEEAILAIDAIALSIEATILKR
jgi:hypothetical protein